MRRRSRAGGEQAKTRRKTVTLERALAPKVTRIRRSSVGGKDKKTALLKRALREALVDVLLPQNEELIGAFSVYRQEVRPFTQKQIALVQNFSAGEVFAGHPPDRQESPP